MAENHKTGLVLLAAGASTRMGRPKQLLRHQGESLLLRALRIALEASFRPVAVVLGARAEELEAELAGTEESASALIVHNSAWASGMGSSVATGLEALLLREPALEAACFILVDQPHLTSAHLLELHRQLERAPEKLGAASAYEPALGVPAIFRKGLFPELLELHGQKGAQPLLKKYKDQILSVPFPKGKIDLDTPEDWDEFLRNETGQAGRAGKGEK
ncbi:MAG: nucleotidyltransferase family protein [Phaeodactylibacter sp.]|nr:nucleotidyltransferase family protein [Phaeodactylibacter sp.]MCB9051992.1 nucleotidyltransferase family protein [Lewinellaceae bacterium]